MKSKKLVAIISAIMVSLSSLPSLTMAMDGKRFYSPEPKLTFRHFFGVYRSPERYSNYITFSRELDKDKNYKKNYENCNWAPANVFNKILRMIAERYNNRSSFYRDPSFINIDKKYIEDIFKVEKIHTNETNQVRRLAPINNYKPIKISDDDIISDYDILDERYKLTARDKENISIKGRQQILKCLDANIFRREDLGGGLTSDEINDLENLQNFVKYNKNIATEKFFDIFITYYDLLKKCKNNKDLIKSLRILIEYRLAEYLGLSAKLCENEKEMSNLIEGLKEGLKKVGYDPALSKVPTPTVKQHKKIKLNFNWDLLKK